MSHSGWSNEPAVLEASPSWRLRHFRSRAWVRKLPRKHIRRRGRRRSTPQHRARGRPKLLLSLYDWLRLLLFTLQTLGLGNCYANLYCTILARGKSTDQTHSSAEKPVSGGPTVGRTNPNPLQVEHRHDSRPGPKSGGHPAQLRHVFTALFVLSFLVARVAGVRVGEDSPHSPRAVQAFNLNAKGPAKPRELPQPYPGQGASTPFRKRAFKRAVRTAVQSGHVTYRGRTYVAKQFGVASEALPPRQPRTKHKPRPAGHRLPLFTWNSSSLCGGSYVEFRGWLKQHSHQYDIVTVTETWWRHDCQWEEQNWFCVHTGTDQGKGAGVLVLVHKRVGNTDLRFQTLIPGRILHLRLHPQCTVDLVACYQKVWSGHATIQERKLVWDQLQFCMMNCPRRNMLILTGDFNVQLQACPAVTGQLPWRSTHVVCADADRFYELMRMGSLQVINSFRGYVPTYIADRSNRAPGTMIDFFCVRTEQADPEARLATVLTDVPLKAHVKANFHRPRIATVPWRRPSFTGKASRCDPLNRLFTTFGMPRQGHTPGTPS